MKVIFLDIDGVLNGSVYRREQMLQGKISVILQPEPLACLQRIAASTDASIALISSWKKFWERDGSVDSAGLEIEQTLNGLGLFIADKTPVIPGGSRSAEVEQWLKNKRYVEQYVILDDKDFSWTRKQRPHWVQCPGDTGLTNDLADMAIAILNGHLIKPTAKNLFRRLLRRQ